MKWLCGFFFCLSSMAAPKAYQARGRLNHTADGYFVDFGHGYVAQLYIGTRAPIDFQTSLKLVETTCGDLEGEVNCRYDTKYGMNKANWLWIHHPDKTRIGKVISYKKLKQNRFHELDGNIAFETVYAPKRHSSGIAMPPDELTCNRYDWLASGAKSKKLITSWFASNMGVNSETGAAENRALFSLVGVHFQIENGKMILEDYDEVQTFSDFFINPFEHDQQSMILSDGENNCQVNWVRHVQPSENKKYFAEQMRPISDESPVPVKEVNLFTENQLKAATIEFTRQPVIVQ